jgi:hypothetical protein
LPIDRPLPPADFADPNSVRGRSRTEVILILVKREKPTLQQLLGYLARARGQFVTAGTPEQIAELIEAWFTDGAADGFNIMPTLLPAQLDVFSAEVIPILQRRGLFRTEYTGAMLREHYGVFWPTSVFDNPGWTPELREAVAGVLPRALANRVVNALREQFPASKARPTSKISAAIQNWGWTMPVLADEEGVLLASHTRVGAPAGPTPTIRTRGASFSGHPGDRLPNGRVLVLPRLPAAGRDQLTPIRSVINYQPATLRAMIA